MTGRINQLLSQKENFLAGHLLGKEIQIEFLSTNDVLAIHDQVVGLFGGTNGVRDMALLESAVHRPMQAASYENLSTPQACALLAQAIIKNHAFLDGNKRSGFFSMVVMLDANGYDFDAQAPDIVYTVKALAGNEISDQAFVEWVERCSVPRIADTHYEDEQMCAQRPRTRG